MSQAVTFEQLLNMQDKALEDVRKIHESQKLLLRACREAVAMDAKACCDTEPWLATGIRDRMTAAIAETEREKP